MEETYFRKGFGLKKELKPVIDAEYQSAMVERIRARGYTDVFGDVTVRLAQEFGFCYGVDRAVDYAYETVHKFPDKTIHLVGEIIHNPFVNGRLTEMGISFIYPEPDRSFDFTKVTKDDVVLIPAFGVTLHDFDRLRDIGCVLVDTTCGSVLHVWKRVETYARDGFTSVIHGKHTHEESRATASQVNKYDGGSYIIVRDMAEAGLICDYIGKRPGHLSREAFMDHFREKVSEGFDPDEQLQYLGVANQTTMLAHESMAIGMKLHDAMVEAMMKSPPAVMLVVGGYNSSNTNHLAHLCRGHTKTFHIEDALCIDVKTGTIRHKVELDPHAPEMVEEGWLPEGPFELGITAGASTPNNKIGETLLRVLEIRGIEVDLEG